MVSAEDTPATHEVTITRTFDAPRELVFDVWTQPEHLAQWFGPKDFTNPVCELDLRPGGAILIHLMGPDGVVFPMNGVFEEIVPPERLVYSTSAFADEAGNPMVEDLRTARFDADDGKTILTFHAAITRLAPGAEDAPAGMEEGWNETFDKLAVYLATI